MTADALGRLDVAVIGCGKVAQNVHLPALAKSATCRLVAVCDASSDVAELVGQRYAVKNVYTDIGAVLRDPSVAAVIIAVGDPQHVEVSARALAAGKHVLVEKPLGVDVAECLTLRDQVATSDRILQVGVMKRQDPGVAYARQAIQNLGHALSFNLWYRASLDRYVDESKLFLPVFRDPAYRQPPYKQERRPYYLATHGSHVFDLVRFMFGQPVDLQAALHVHEGSYSWHVLLRLEDGVVGHVELSVYVDSEWSEGFDIFCERGRVAVRSPNPFFLRPSTVRVFEGQAMAWHEPAFTDGDAYLRQLDAFAASALHGAPVVATINDGIGALEMIEAVSTSIASGSSWVRLQQAYA